MTAHTTTEGTDAQANNVTRLAVATDDQTSPDEEALGWLAEGERLFAEAQARLESGEVLPALSSLAAVPPLHRMLVDRFSELMTDDSAAADGHDCGLEPEPLACGGYL